MQTTIIQERPDTADALMLIDELEGHLKPNYPPVSRHGLSSEQLIQQGVAFFVMRQGDTPTGCGGIKLFDTAYGELKRMYVRPHFRRLGLSKLMLNHLTEFALQHGVTIVRLETGIYQTEAIGLYERFGFQRVGPFGAYREDPLSLFYEKRFA